MEILKPVRQIYGHQQPQSVEGLRLDDVATLGMLIANMFDYKSVEVVK